MNDELKVLQKFIANPQKISKVTTSNDERFFVYDDKHVFSLLEVDEGGNKVYYFHSYLSLPLEQALKASSSKDFVAFNSNDYESSNKVTFANVYSLLLSKMNGVDKIFDDILSDDEEDF